MVVVVDWTGYTLLFAIVSSVRLCVNRLGLLCVNEWDQRG